MKQKIVQKDIIKVCDKIKEMLNSAFVESQFEKVLSLIDIYARINYNFNFIYTDLEIEDLLSKLSSKLILSKTDFVPISGRVVFYDFFCAGKVLELQYLRAFMAWGIEFLYIIERNSWNNLCRVLPEIEQYDKAEIFEIEETLSLTEKICLTYDRIVKYKPEKAFLQLAPWDVVAVTIFHALPQITRYQINLTDHAFWLGTKCIDYIIEFRNYGCTVSFEKRGISQKKILLQPFYPIIKYGDFQGFPEQVTKDNVVIFSGASYYKIYGEDKMFFRMLTDILELNPSVIILYAGQGDEGPLVNFIKKNNYEKRIFLLGFRSDINEVLEHCDIYLDTYPVGGGLMSQLAAINSKPILSYSNKMGLLNDVDSVVCTNNYDYINISHSDYTEFLKDANRLIHDKDYRSQMGCNLKKCMISSFDFNINLRKLIMLNKNEFDFHFEDIDYENIYHLYLDVENNYLHSFLLMMGKKFGFSTFRLFPKIAFLMFMYVLRNPRSILLVFKRKKY